MKVQSFVTLGWAPEMKSLTSGTTVTSGSVVDTVSVKKWEEYVKTPNWYNVVVWGKNWERFAKLPKGTPLFITWELMIEEYTAADQSKRKNAKIRIDSFVPFSWFLKTSDMANASAAANNPVANAPIANAPVANSPIANSTIANVPFASTSKTEFNFG